MCHRSWPSWRKGAASGTTDRNKTTPAMVLEHQGRGRQPLEPSARWNKLPGDRGGTPNTSRGASPAGRVAIFSCEPEEALTAVEAHHLLQKYPRGGRALDCPSLPLPPGGGCGPLRPTGAGQT